MKKLNSLGEIVTDKIENEKKFKEAFIIANWKNIVGKKLSEKSQPLYIKNKTLIMRVENSAWIQQINFLKKEIIKNINDFLNGNYIEKLSIRTGKINDYDIEEDKKEENNNIDLKSINLEREDIFLIKSIIENIKDEDIKRSFYRAMSKNLKKRKILYNEGYKECSNCGELFLGNSNYCSKCIIVKKEERIKRIYNFINKNPYVSIYEVRNKLGVVTKEEYDVIKSKLRDDYYRMIIIYKKEKKMKKFEEYAYRYIMLDSGTKNLEKLREKVNKFIESFT